MNTFLSLFLWIAVMTSSCYGDTENHEENLTTENYDYATETLTPEYDYDYTATFDYYFVTGLYISEVHNKAAGIGQINLVLLLGLAALHVWT